MTRSPAIEAKGELVEIVRQMLTLDAALVGPQQPPFEQRRNSMHSWEEAGPVLPLSAYSHDVGIASLLQGVWLHRFHG